MSEAKLTDEQAQHAVAYIRHFLERGATIRARGGMPVLQPDGDKWVSGGLHIQMPAEWVKTSDRLPTREDADEHGYVWSYTPDSELETVSTAEWSWVAALPHSNWAIKATHWMPKPRVQPPEPPEVE